jgi:dTDP-4-amino-4,6-dideoxygalactose transaminase
MKVPFYKPSLPPYELVEADFRDAYERGMLAPSKYTERFVRAVEEHLGVKHAVAFSNCSDAMMCLVGYLKDLTGKSTVIVPTFTFAATWQAVDWNGMNTLLVDVDSHGRLDPVELEKALREHHKDIAAVLAVHMFGCPPDLGALQELTMKYKTHLIFDAAHGFGTLVGGKPLGSSGLAEVFSIGTTKTLAAGEGGVLTTNDDQLAEAMYRAAMHGHKYGELDVELKSLNGRIQEINSIIGYHGLPLLRENIEKRQIAAAFYSDALCGRVWGGFDLRPPAVEESVVPSYKDYTVFLSPRDRSAYDYYAGRKVVDVRDQLVAALESRGVGTKRYYFPDISRLTVIQTGQGLGGKVETYRAFCRGRLLANTCISLPFFTDITREQQGYVLEMIDDAFDDVFK